MGHYVNAKSLECYYCKKHSLYVKEELCPMNPLYLAQRDAAKKVGYETVMNILRLEKEISEKQEELAKLKERIRKFHL